MENKKNRNVFVIKDVDGNDIVMINDIIFKGKKSIDWDEVETYLKRYIGDFYSIIETGDQIYVGADLPDEFAHSNYTKGLKGANKKAKANVAQGIPELIEIATGKHFRKNTATKHQWNAKYGWYRYDSRFAIPVYKENELIGYNVYHASLLIRHSNDGKKYLYDIIDIKKETSNPLES